MAAGRAAEIYREDLAYVHDAGFGDFARAAAPGVLAALREAKIEGGLVADLGCGSGILAADLVEAGYDVFGVDVSEAALAIARRRVPAARFERGSVLDADLTACAAAVAVGEVLGYAADERLRRGSLAEVFGRIAAALAPGGVLCFDLAGPGREPVARQGWREGEGWVCCFEAEEDPDRSELRRRIAVFRETEDGWRRSDEEHVLRLHEPAAVLAELDAAGFDATAASEYAPGAPLPPGITVYSAVRRSA